MEAAPSWRRTAAAGVTVAARVRTLFLSGQEAAEDGRWGRCRPPFFALGRLREARDAFRRLLTEHPEIDPQRRATVERLLGVEVGLMVLAAVVVVGALGCSGGGEGSPDGGDDGGGSGDDSGSGGDEGPRCKSDSTSRPCSSHAPRASKSPMSPSKATSSLSPAERMRRMRP